MMNGTYHLDVCVPVSVEEAVGLGAGVGVGAGVWRRTLCLITGYGITTYSPDVVSSPTTTLTPQLSQNLESCRTSLPHSLQNITRLPIACEVTTQHQSLHQHLVLEHSTIYHCPKQISKPHMPPPTKIAIYWQHPVCL